MKAVLYMVVLAFCVLNTYHLVHIRRSLQTMQSTLDIIMLERVKHVQTVKEQHLDDIILRGQ